MSEKVFGKKEFFNPPKRYVEKVFIKSLDAYVYIRKINALDQETYLSEITISEFNEKNEPIVKPKFDGMRLKYLVRVLSDENGNRLFKNDEYTKLGEWDKDVIDELYEKAVEVNNVSDEALKKNLGLTQSANLPLG